MPENSLLKFTDKGICCPQAEVYIDPWRKVDKALITHAHSDHARWGMKYYLCHKHSLPILRYRLGNDINAESIEYGKTIKINDVKISFHPSGHILGAAQIRLEYKGEVAVVSGDYKVEYDNITPQFEPVKCNTFVSESTFGLPIYNWQPQDEIFAGINNWWKRNKEQGKNSVIFGYVLGKTQRILYNIDRTIGDVYAHGSIVNVNNLFIKEGIKLPEISSASSVPKEKIKGALIIAPGSAKGTPWLKRFEPYSTGNASGWMAVRGAKRRMAVDIGFALSDHADWKGLNWAIKETGAEHVYVTHGFTHTFKRWLLENNIEADEVKTEFEGEAPAEDLVENTEPVE